MRESYAYRVARTVRISDGGMLTLVSGQASQCPCGHKVREGLVPGEGQART